MGGAGVVSSRFLRWFGLGTKAFLWWVFGGSGISPIFPSFSPHPVRNRMLVSLRGGGGELGNLKP
jgi:hypothetical protein